jgi:hypothetical protein
MDTPTMWLCRQCESVCPGVVGEVPAPCDFCGSSDIENVGPDAEERLPKPPWDDPENWYYHGYDEEDFEDEDEDDL